MTASLHVTTMLYPCAECSSAMLRPTPLGASQEEEEEQWKEQPAWTFLHNNSSARGLQIRRQRGSEYPRQRILAVARPFQWVCLHMTLPHQSRLHQAFACVPPCLPQGAAVPSSLRAAFEQMLQQFEMQAGSATTSNDSTQLHISLMQGQAPRPPQPRPPQ